MALEDFKDWKGSSLLMAAVLGVVAGVNRDYVIVDPNQGDQSSISRNFLDADGGSYRSRLSASGRDKLKRPYSGSRRRRVYG